MTTSSFTKRTGFPASFEFIQKGDKANLICTLSHYFGGELVLEGTEIQGEVAMLCPELSYIAIAAKAPGFEKFKTLYPLYPEKDVRARWKLKLKDTYLGSQLRARADKVRKDKIQQNLIF